MKQILNHVLSQNQKRRIVDPDQTSAAVLLPVYYTDGEYHILFIKRTQKVKKHRGEISFPGGAFEKRDGTLLNTALRETAEEIGLASEEVEILGELDDVVSVKTKYVISPFVAFIPWPYPFQVDGKETEEIIEAPISVLLDHGYSRQELRDGKAVTSYFYPYQGRTIWGATAKILYQFLDIFSRAVSSQQ